MGEGSGRHKDDDDELEKKERRSWNEGDCSAFLIPLCRTKNLLAISGLEI